MPAKTAKRDRIVSLSEEERLMLRCMLADKSKWISAACRSLSLDPGRDATAALIAVELFEMKIAEISSG